MTIQLHDLHAYLKDAIEFFVQLDAYLEGRGFGTANGARGESRFVSVWEGEIGQVNGKHSLGKVLKLLNSLPRVDSDDLAEPMERVSIAAAEVSVLDKAQLLATQGKYSKIAATVTNHLHRALELLQELNFNTERSMAFIPVAAHKSLAQKMRDSLDKCNEVLNKHHGVILQANTTVPKTWLTQEIQYDSLLVATRATALGLSKKTVVYPGVPEISSQQAEANYHQALVFMKEIADKVDAVARKDLVPTKTTRRILGVSNSAQTPSSASVHWQYCPKGVREKMLQLRDLVRAKPDSLTQDEVDATIKVTFPPEPTTRYSQKR
jgi:hypothetical protein